MAGRRRQAVTIRHVAADAAVSLQTVSRVINDESNVRPEMKLRVQASIDKLGYVPSIAARRLSGSRSRLILALNDRDRTIADWRERQGTDWVDQMLLGGVLKSAEYGYRLMFELVDTHNDHVERELRATIAGLQPDGLILTPPHSDNPLIIDLLAQESIIFARIGSQAKGPGITLNMDDEQAAAIATRRLIALGHRRIGFISGSPEYSLSAWRVSGWRSAMRDAGLDIDELLVEGDFSYASGERAAAALMKATRRPTAIIASNDRMAVSTLDTARELGIKVPEQLSIVSFDNTPIVRFTHPSLTAIDQPIADITACAVQLIIDAQAGRPLPPGPTMFKAPLVVRESTAGPPRA
jgi:LacI family transcriptional regulator